MSYISSTYTSLYYHIVFSTKKRTPLLRNKEILDHLKAYVIGYTNNSGAKSIIVNGTKDHIHLLFQVNNTHFDISEFVRELKKSTNKMLNETFFNGRFTWQEGYFVGTISRWDTDKRRDIFNFKRNITKQCPSRKNGMLSSIELKKVNHKDPTIIINLGRSTRRVPLR